ncbi:mtp family protein [Pseudorasbora parva]|uniref:mtp family protein n=1 Tax=Pseudorasbora parva TaxID=51549 RepID=UPI00351DE509
MSGTRTLCCHVNTATLTFAILYLIVNMVRLVGTCLTVSWENVGYSVSYYESKAPRGQRVFDISTNILMLVLMSISALLVLFSQRKRPMCVLPFALMMCVEVTLSFLSLCYGAFSVPGVPTYRDVIQAMKELKGINKLNEEDIGQFTMLYSVTFMLGILLKLYALRVSMKCFYLLKEQRATDIHVDSGNTVTVKLPSYDEALKMKAEGKPPTYQEP